MKNIMTFLEFVENGKSGERRGNDFYHHYNAVMHNWEKLGYHSDEMDNAKTRSEKAFHRNKAEVHNDLAEYHLIALETKYGKGVRDRHEMDMLSNPAYKGKDDYEAAELSASRYLGVRNHYDSEGKLIPINR